MKKITTFIIACLIAFSSLTSCFGVYETYATTQDDIYVETTTNIVRSNVSFGVVITNGTPYYYEGSLLYYLYNGIYYYPYYYNNYWYVRAYSRPFAHIDRRPYFRPNRYDYKFKPGTYREFSSTRPPRRDPRFEPRTNINRQPNRFDNAPRRIEQTAPRRVEQRPNSSNIRTNQPQNRIQPQTRIQTPTRTQPQMRTAPNTPSRGNVGGRVGGGRR